MKVLVVGASGRMGRYVLQAVLDHPQLELQGALVRAKHPLLGMDVGHLLGRSALGVSLTQDLDAALSLVDLVIDFTEPQYSLNLLEAAVNHQVAVVLGTTGFNDAQKQRIEALAQSLPICMASNFSRGVHLLHHLVTEACKVLGDEADIEVIEAHHRHKVDAPSGTALSLGETLGRALKRDMSTQSVYGRQGITGERPQQQVGFATIRAGDIVGDHRVLFALEGERIEISHSASSRMTFAKGAADAAAKMDVTTPGLFAYRP